MLGDEELLKPPYNIKNQAHRRAVLAELDRIKTLGVKPPQNLWEYKVTMSGLPQNTVPVKSLFRVLIDALLVENTSHVGDTFSNTWWQIRISSTSEKVCVRILLHSGL